MRIHRIDDAIERCRRHLSAAEAVDKEIESLLVQSLLILIYSEFERKFRDLIRERCSSVSDRSINEYIESHVRRSPRGLKLSDVARTLAQFGPTHRTIFDRQRGENRQIESMYSSIVNNRHNIAHGEGSNATFQEVKQYYESGHEVLDYFKDALFWSDEEDATNDD